MKKFIFITFLPGAAGNFFSRSLQLLNNAYGYVDKAKDPPYIPITIEEKLTLVNYDSVVDKNYEERHWVDFENNIGVYCEHYPNYTIPDNGILILSLHPHANRYYDSLVGKNDKKFVFYMDPTDEFEWVSLNASYKNSVHHLVHFHYGKKHMLDPGIYKIKLSNIIMSFDGFFMEFEKVCEIIEHKISQDEKHAIKCLYDQWTTTTLSKKTIRENYI